MAGFALAVSTVVFVAAQSRHAILPDTKSYVLSQENAYLLLSADPVAGSESRNLLWSSDGGHLLVRSTDIGEETLVKSVISGRPEPDPTENSIIVYRLTDKRKMVLWHAKASEEQLQEVDWFAGTNRFVLVSAEPVRTEDPSRPPHSRQSVKVFDADRGISTTALTLTQEGGFPSAAVAMSPTKPYGLLITNLRAEVPTAVAAGGTTPPIQANMDEPMECSLLRADGSFSHLSVDPSLHW
ncbi:MAG TPA: hypothetical protein VG820_07095, partial [Fimbriimonadaceae bacterium]|nr:hypothetical protein [Fimbriimonadaceae bacterium]